MRVVVLFGTHPEVIKLAPVVRELRWPPGAKNSFGDGRASERIVAALLNSGDAR